MTANDFFEHFTTLADAPGSIANLRDLILQLAIQGKLAAQNGRDGTAGRLYEQMKSAKRDSGNGRSNAGSTNFEPIDDAETPFPIPVSWKWCRIGEAMNLHNGRAFKPSDWSSSGIPIIRIQNLNNPDAPFNHFDGEVGEKNMVKKDDFLISWSGTPGTSFGAFIWAREKAVLNQHIFRADLLGDGFEKSFLRCAINARLEEMIAKAHGGVGLQHITKGKLENLTIPLPPLAEQKRIVAKVDRLMALCDALERQQQARHAVRSRLHATLLGNLQTAANAADFARAWQRLRDHFAELFTPGEAALDAVAQLRQTILHLAVQGKLVPQDGEDEAAEAFLRSIGTAAETPSEVEIPFSLPARWSWVRLGQLGRFCGGGTPSKNNPSFWQGAIPWVSPKDMKTPYIHDVPDHISAQALEQSSAQMIPAESLLMVVRGMILIHTFPMAMAKCDLTINQDMKALKLHSPQIGDYLLRVFAGSQPRMLSKIRRSSHGTCRLDSADLAGFLIGLPPLAEQQRIVAKVQQLMAQCDALEASLKAAATVSERWSAAAVRRLLDGAT